MAMDCAKLMYPALHMVVVVIELIAAATGRGFVVWLMIVRATLGELGASGVLGDEALLAFWSWDRVTLHYGTADGSLSGWQCRGVGRLGVGVSVEHCRPRAGGGHRRGLLGILQLPGERTAAGRCRRTQVCSLFLSVARLIWGHHHIDCKSRTMNRPPYPLVRKPKAAHTPSRICGQLCDGRRIYPVQSSYSKSMALFWTSSASSLIQA